MNATMTSEETKHQPVMLDQVLSIISPQHGGTFIDCTFGGGGYSNAILKHSNTKVFAIDRDDSVKKYANNLVKKFPNRFNFIQDKFSNLSKISNSNLNPKAIIFDLGLSSFQLSDDERGFSFNSNNSKSFLSMKMGINKYSAYDVINNLDKKNLANIIKVLGDEKDGRLIARKIAESRIDKKIKTPKDLVDIIKKAKKKYKNYKKNPATKTFQAIRVYVNKELTELIHGLIEATKLLSNNGILLVISFHSLEDRIVKYFFNFYSNLKGNPSRYLPNENKSTALFKVLSKRSKVPKISEIENNIRSRSAKLRYAIRNERLFFYPDELEKKFINYLKVENIQL
jgi:16S rRNA (cytosine1402-N4)-methyltransferase